MKLIVTTDGVETVLKGLDTNSERALNLEPALKLIEQVILRSADKNFLAGGRPDSWAPLAPATIKRRRNKDKGSIQILRDTGYLQQSLSPGGGNQFSVRILTARSVSIGTNRPGGMAHQEGKGVPQRRFLVHQEEDINDYRDILTDHILGFGE